MQVVVVKTKWLEQSHSNLSLKAAKIIAFPRTLSNKVKRQTDVLYFTFFV